MPLPLPPLVLTISAAVVTTAIAMPTMPKMLPRIEVVGCDSPFSAWMKQTLATRYSSVTTFRLMSESPACDPSSLRRASLHMPAACEPSLQCP